MSRRVRPARAVTVVSAVVMLGGLAAFAFGCPIYATDSCRNDPSCAQAEPVPTNTYDTGPGDCGVCAPGYVCSYVTSGRYQCAAYDCRAAERACPSDATCTDMGGTVYGCIGADGGPIDTGLESGPADTGPVDTGPNDCTKTGCIAGMKCDTKSSPAVCVSTDPNACVADADCTAKTGAGSLCLGGTCKAPKDLCTDSTQCKSGSACVDGRCTPTCTGGSDAGTDAAVTSCASGYSCVSGTCSGGTGVCGAGGGDAGDAGASCSSSASCVAGRCAAKCAIDGACPGGQVCVGGGCVYDDRPIFFCDKSGTADGSQDVCASGSICLHHNCYLTCGGASDTTTCAKADKFPTCKSVTTSSGVHFVCGSSTNLGGECDPTTTPPKSCVTGKICVDGFCK